MSEVYPEYKVGPRYLSATMARRVGLAWTAFWQVALVVGNVGFASRGAIGWVFVSSFCINWLWTGNVKKIAAGSLSDRLWYSLGAATGGACGLWLSGVLQRITWYLVEFTHV